MGRTLTLENQFVFLVLYQKMVNSNSNMHTKGGFQGYHRDKLRYHPETSKPNW